jgi:hypothetical protein
MSNYRIGAFEALEWTWHTLRDYRNQPKGIDDVRQLIHDILLKMGDGSNLDFGKKISEIKASVSCG